MSRLGALGFSSSAEPRSPRLCFLGGMDKQTFKQCKEAVDKHVFKDPEAGGAKFSQLKNPCLPPKRGHAKNTNNSSRTKFETRMAPYIKALEISKRITVQCNRQTNSCTDREYFC